MAWPTFKIGDRVRLRTRTARWYGFKGVRRMAVVTSKPGPLGHVKLSGLLGDQHSWHVTALEKVPLTAREKAARQ